jgi:2-keto-4-pentenoate hydratase/2-oxohepta-3-ene-1,7-dioic acid hydratase in catechol pathway
MKLASFCEPSGPPKLGIVDHEIIYDLGNFASGPLEIFQREISFAQIEKELKGANALKLSEICLLPPIPKPSKFLGIAFNYKDHAKEMNRELPQDQIWFNKQNTCVIGPNQAIKIPTLSSAVDYEAELGIVIKKSGRYIKPEDAHNYVAGYLIVNDVSARDWQFRTPTWTLGKSFDTHGPIGPFLVSPDEIKDPHNLRIKTWVNDELRQNSSTDQMIFSCWEMISHLSKVFTLEPGDILSTGTPAGSGFTFDPPKFLKPNDIVKIEISSIGVLQNPVEAESN